MCFRASIVCTLPSEEKGLETRPEADNLVGIYAALAGASRADVLKQFGGAQFSAFKGAMTELLVAKLAPVNAEMLRPWVTMVICMEARPEGIFRLR